MPPGDIPLPEPMPSGKAKKTEADDLQDTDED